MRHALTINVTADSPAQAASLVRQAVDEYLSTRRISRRCMIATARGRAHARWETRPSEMEVESEPIYGSEDASPYNLDAEVVR
jgi:hypothetical protein